MLVIGDICVGELKMPNEEPNYYKIIKEFPHIIDDSKIVLKYNLYKNGNTLKQFSDVVDELIKGELKAILDKIESFKNERDIIDYDKFRELKEQILGVNRQCQAKQNFG